MEKIYHVHGLEELLLKWSYYPRQSTVQCNPYQNTNGIFQRTRTNNTKFVWKNKRPWIAVTILRKKTELGVSCALIENYTTKLQSSKQYGTGTKHRSMEQNREPGNEPTLTCTIYDKGGKNIQRGKDSLYNKWCWENWMATCKRIKWTAFSHYMQT